jgi:hypothetical protein
MAANKSGESKAGDTGNAVSKLKQQTMGLINPARVIARKNI